MQDLFPQSKIVFWGAVLLALALAMVPSLAFLDTATQYLRFVMAWDPGTIPMTHTSYPAGREQREQPVDSLQPRIVEFTFKAPKAKQVLIAGDFDDWQPEKMTSTKGRWRLLLPLPPGRYRYAFQVDGVWTPDPAVSETAVKGDLKTSVRQVH